MNFDNIEAYLRDDFLFTLRVNLPLPVLRILIPKQMDTIQEAQQTQCKVSTMEPIQKGP
jgi:hypothetical protein